MQGARFGSDLRQRNIENERADRLEKTEQSRYDYEKSLKEEGRQRENNRRLALSFDATEKQAYGEYVASLPAGAKESQDAFAEFFFTKYGAQVNEVMNSHSALRGPLLDGAPHVDQKAPSAGFQVIEAPDGKGGKRKALVPMVNVQNKETGEMYAKPVTKNRSSDPNDIVVMGSPSQMMASIKAQLAQDGYTDTGAATRAAEAKMARAATTVGNASRSASLSDAAPGTQPVVAPAVAQTVTPAPAPALSGAVPVATAAAVPAAPAAGSFDPRAEVGKFAQSKARQADAEFIAGLDPTQQQGFGAMPDPQPTGKGFFQAAEDVVAAKQYAVDRKEMVASGKYTPEQIAQMDSTFGVAMLVPATVIEGKTPEQQKKLTEAASKPATSAQKTAAAPIVQRASRRAPGPATFQENLAAVHLGLKGADLARFAQTRQYEKPDFFEHDPEKELISKNTGETLRASKPKAPTAAERTAAFKLQYEMDKDSWEDIDKLITQHRGTGKYENRNLSRADFTLKFMDFASEAAARGMSIDPQSLSNPYMRAKVVQMYVEGKKFDNEGGLFSKKHEGTPQDAFDARYGTPKPVTNRVPVTAEQLSALPKNADGTVTVNGKTYRVITQ